MIIIINTTVFWSMIPLNENINYRYTDGENKGNIFHGNKITQKHTEI